MGKLWILVQIAATPFAVIYMLAISKWRFSKRTTLTAITAFTVAILITDYLLFVKLYYLIEPYPVLDIVARLSHIILEIAVYLALTRHPLTQSVFIMLSGSGCVLIVDTLTVSTQMVFGFNLPVLLFELLLYPLMTFLVYKVREPFWEVSGHLKKRLWLLSLVQAILIVCFLFLVSFPVPLTQASSNIPAAVMFCGVTIAIYGTIFYLFKIVLAQSKLEKDTLIMELYTSSLERQNHIHAQNAEMAGIFRHDLRHITQMMLACLDRGDIDGIRELLLNIDDNVGTAWAESYFKAFTGHNFIDATFSHYIAFAKESGIDISVNIGRMDSVNADKTELSVVLANALENAVHACEKIPEGGERAIRVDGRRCGKQYFIEIANTCANEVRFDADTGLPVSDREGHGLGSQSIAFFAQKYGAELECGQNGNWFHLRILMRLLLYAEA